jgi:hypothetical protein
VLVEATNSDWVLRHKEETMRQGNWCLATAGVLAVTLLGNSALAGSVLKSDALRANNGKVASASNVGNVGSETSGELQPRMEIDPSLYDRSSFPAAGSEFIVWDNNYGTDINTFFLAAQCDTFACTSADGDLVGFLADDIDLQAGTLVNGVRFRILLQNAVPGIDGVQIQIWPDNAPCPGEPSLATFELTDLDTIGANTTLQEIRARFNAGEVWEAPGGKHWITITPILPTPPQTFLSGVSTIKGGQAFQAFQPSDETMPFSTASPAAGGPCVTNTETSPSADVEFQLFGTPAQGGIQVLTINGSGSAGCVVRVNVNSGGLSDCTPGPCPVSPLGGNCRGSTVVTAAETPEALALAIAADFAANAVCTGANVTMTAAGNRLVVETDNGAIPRLCLGGTVEGLIGGPLGCTQASCGFTYQIGPIIGVDTPDPITAGTDRFTTTKECAAPTTFPNGTWQVNSYPSGYFDISGLNTSDALAITQQLSGVAENPPADGTVVDDADTSVVRLTDAVLGLCNGDFSNPVDGPTTTRNPDGVVDVNDTGSFALCLGNIGTGECSFFDFDGNGAVDANDGTVLACLEAANNSTDCCPGNTTLPLSADVPLQLTNLHLRSCDYFSVTRAGQSGWPEYWWCDYYLSGTTTGIGQGDLGPCTAGDSETNNVKGEADELAGTAFVGRGNPLRVNGSISDTSCTGTTGETSFPGVSDLDVYRFSIAFDDLVVINLRGRGDGESGDCGSLGTMAVASLYLYTESGALIGSSEPPLPGGVWTGATEFTDPSISADLGNGVYYVAVGSGGQAAPPDILAASCGVAPVPLDDDAGQDSRGAYELNVAVTNRSLMTITKTDPTGGTFDSKLLVQPLVTYQKVGDPFHSIMLDSGDQGMSPTQLYSQGSSWTNNNTVAGLIPGDSGFVPGVSADGTTEAPLTEYNDQATPAASTIIHTVAAPRSPKCDIPDTNCLYTQAPDDRETAVGSIVVFDSDVEPPVELGDFTAADDFQLGAPANIASVQFWGTPQGGSGHTFDVTFWSDGDGEVGNNCASAPEAILAAYEDLEPTDDTATLIDTRRITLNIDPPFAAAAGTRYWVEIVQVLGTTQVFWEQSASGNDVYFQDVAAEANFDGDGCPSVTGANLIGNGYDCTPGVDDGGTATCDEGFDTNGDQETGDLAFCLSESSGAQFTKLLPWDIACGNWRSMAGEIIWHQPVARSGTAGNISDRIPNAGSGDGGRIRADDVTFFTAQSITDIHWRGFYSDNDPEADKFSIEVYSDAGGLPGNLIQNFGTPVSPIPSGISREQGGFTSSSAPGRTIYHYWYDISGTPINFAANETKWIAIINDSSGAAREYTWSWARSDGGNANGSAASTDLDISGLPEGWEAGAFDFSFDLTVAGSEKIITTMSIDDPAYAAGAHFATGLGYRFDSDYLYIHGYEFGDGANGSFSSDTVRFHRVRGPWKHYTDLPVSIPVGSLVTGDFGGLGGITQDDLDALTRNQAGTTAVGLLDGLAAFDISAARNGEANGGTIDRLCNGAAYQFVAASTALNERFWVKGICWDNGTASAVLHPHVAPECFDETECEDSGDRICSIGACDDGDGSTADGDCGNTTVASTCCAKPNRYGDVNHVDNVNLFDILCVLDGFSGLFNQCSKVDVDIAPCPTGPPYEFGDGTINIFDILGVLSGFSGDNSCCDALPSPSAPARGGSELAAGRPVRESNATLKLVASSRTANAGDVISVDVFVSGATDLQGYELSTAVTGGRRGDLSLIDTSIADRKDFVLSAVENVTAVDMTKGRLAGAAYTGGVASAGAAYVGTFTFQVSADAVGSFRVGLGSDVHVVDSSGQEISVSRVTPATILISSSARGL